MGEAACPVPQQDRARLCGLSNPSECAPHFPHQKARAGPAPVPAGRLQPTASQLPGRREAGASTPSGTPSLHSNCSTAHVGLLQVCGVTVGSCRLLKSTWRAPPHGHQLPTAKSNRAGTVAEMSNRPALSASCAWFPPTKVILSSGQRSLLSVGENPSEA